MDMEPYRERVQSFVTRGNYHAAINIAISGLNECRRNEDQNGVDQCLVVIQAVIDDLSQAFGSETFLSGSK